MSRDPDSTDASVDELGSAASLLRGLAAAPGGDTAVLVAGAVVAEQYRVERVLGEGGMGVVYLARDERLGRAVALKLGRVVSRDGLARIAREAGALAQLSHPNVVVVHQVGDHRGRIFFAMEHVAGGTARAWLAAAPRTWREIVALFCAAGDGLAAAHAVGLVHRDFKPDNVLVGTDGRARVADFGLARAIADADAPADDAALASPAAASITQTGAVLGTPAYMPPEQLAGDDVDARADQFAFCAAAWEALFGARPFTGDTPARVKASIESSEPRTTGGPRARGVPRHVEQALRRGLRPVPADRWPSMVPLLAALRRDPARRRRNALAIGTVSVALVAAIAVPRLSSTRAADPCAGGPAQIAATWSPPRADEIRRALDDPGRPWTRAIAARVVDALDANARRWSVQYRAVCEAGGAAWSAALRDRGMTCLARRRNELDAAVEVLGRATPQLVGRADDVVAGLESPDRCADPAYLASVVPPPTSARIAGAVAVAEQQLARSHALWRSGALDRARVLASTTVPIALALGHGPLIARARAEHGAVLASIYDDQAAIDETREAYFVARSVGDADTAARAAATASGAMLDLSHDDTAADWARLAEVDADAASDPRVRFAALDARAAIEDASGHYARAYELADQEVRAVRATHDPIDLARALHTRANVALDLTRYADAKADLDEAIGAITDAYGPDSYYLINLHGHLALSLSDVGRWDEAIAHARTSVALSEKIMGPDSRDTGKALGNLASVLVQSGRDDEALAVSTRSLANSRRNYGEDSDDVASDLNNRAMMLQQLDRMDEAIAAWTESARIYSKLYGADSSLTALIEGNLADGLWNHGRYAEAVTAADGAVAIFDARHDPRVAYPLLARGGSRTGLGQYRAAKDDLERALALRQGPDIDPAKRAVTEFELAKAIAPLGEVTRARTLATKALATMREVHNLDHAKLAEAFLRTLPASGTSDR